MAHWVSTYGCNIPDNAIRAGCEEDGNTLYIARAEIDGTMTPGKCGPHLLPGAHIPFHG